MRDECDAGGGEHFVGFDLKSEIGKIGGTLEPLIERDKQIGQTIPVNQTPTTIIHTRDGQTFPVVGYVSFDVLKTLLDQLVK